MSCHGASHGLPTYTHQLLAWEIFRNVNLPITLHTLGPPRRAAPGQVAYRSLACQMYRRAMHTVLLAERAAVPAAPCRAVPHRAGRGGADPRTIYLFFPVYLSLSPMLCFLSHHMLCFLSHHKLPVSRLGCRAEATSLKLVMDNDRVGIKLK